MGGVLVGQDKFGNKYYQDITAIFGAHRRVDYASKDFDASQVRARPAQRLEVAHLQTGWEPVVAGPGGMAPMAAFHDGRRARTRGTPKSTLPLPAPTNFGSLA
jgi:hypothetical protein